MAVAATLPTLYNSLEAHLLPTPILSSLPTALQLFADFQLVNKLLKSEAIRALHEIASTKADISDNDAKLLKKVSRRDSDDGMFGCSVEFRRYHLAKLFSTPGLDPLRAQALLDLYFPLNPSKRDRSLFIRIMNDAQVAKLKMYREKAEGWCDVSSKAFTNDPREPPPDLALECLDSKSDLLVKTMLGSARRIMADVQLFEEMFACNPEVVNVRVESPAIKLESPYNLLAGPSSPPRQIKKSPQSNREGNPKASVHGPGGGQDLSKRVEEEEMELLERPGGEQRKSLDKLGKRDATSAVGKKKKRLSGLPPLTGPEYLDNTREKEGKRKLRPFDKATLVTAKKTKVDK
ncbi:hypothetical protein P7C73_g5540, partial [Tremellales sp. Uapishka_1]